MIFHVCVRVCVSLCVITLFLPICLVAFTFVSSLSGIRRNMMGGACLLATNTSWRCVCLSYLLFHVPRHATSSRFCVLVGAHVLMTEVEGVPLSVCHLKAQCTPTLCVR